MLYYSKFKFYVTFAVVMANDSDGGLLLGVTTGCKTRGMFFISHLLVSK